MPDGKEFEQEWNWAEWQARGQESWDLLFRKSGFEIAFQGTEQSLTSLTSLF